MFPGFRVQAADGQHTLLVRRFLGQVVAGNAIFEPHVKFSVGEGGESALIRGHGRGREDAELRGRGFEHDDRPAAADGERILLSARMGEEISPPPTSPRHFSWPDAISTQIALPLPTA